MIIQPSYYNSFKCIADKCKDNCCIGWEIDIDEKSYQSYTAVQGDFGKKLKAGITTDNGMHCFRLDKNERCVFLNNNNLCEIICNLGENALCQICRDHPRYINEYPTHSERGLGLSCEEACRIILTEKEPIAMVCADNKNVSSNSIYNACDKILDKSESIYFNYLFMVRGIIIDILQNRKYKINRRLFAVVKLCNSVQLDSRSDKSDLQLFDSLSELKNYSNSLLNSEPVTSGNIIYTINHLISAYAKLEILSPDWLNILKETLNFIKSHNVEKTFTVLDNAFFSEHIFENICVYFTHRYFLESYYDNMILEKALLTLSSFLLLKSIITADFFKHGKTDINYIAELVHTYSKEIEYSDQNIDALYNSFLNDDMLSADNLANCLF